TALEILALRQQGGGFLPCLTTKILRIYSSRFNWYINIYIYGRTHELYLLYHTYIENSIVFFEQMEKSLRPSSC
ncbi:MAG TPA: hypothetical protein DCG49_07990, partial [Ruminococcus sp.]|nr:hypothetical protein [Ruminococcus sp.]